MEVFIQRDGQQFGPYTVDEVNDFLESGELLPDDLAWYEGAVEWLPLVALEEGDGPAPGYEWADEDEYATVPETDPHAIYVPFAEAESEGIPTASAEFHSAPETADASMGEEYVTADLSGYARDPEPIEEVEHTHPAKPERPQTALVPGPIVTPPPVAAAPTVRNQQPPWVPPRRDTSGPLPHPSNMKRSALAAFSGTPFTIPPHVAAANEPVISEKEALQMAKKFAAQGDAMINPERSAAVRKVMIGGLLFIAGIVGTIVSYQESTSKAGGGGLMYVIAWGFIAFGALLFIRGLLQIFGD
jgi:hypothetical protein